MSMRQQEQYPFVLMRAIQLSDTFSYWWSMNIGERIAKVMSSKGWSEGELGRRSGVPQPTIHRIITGQSTSPRLGNLEQIARALGVTVDSLWIEGGSASTTSKKIKRPTSSKDFELYSVSTGHVYRVPLIALEHALEWRSGGYDLSRAEVFMPCPVEVGPHAFFFIMPNDSMLGQKTEKSIPEGWLVYVDPDSVPQPGQIALGSFNKNTPIVGILIEHGGETFLKPSNHQYEKVKVDPNNPDWCLGRVVFFGMTAT